MEKEKMHACMHVTMLDYTLWSCLVQLLLNLRIRPKLHCTSRTTLVDVYGHSLVSVVRACMRTVVCVSVWRLRTV